MPSDCYRVQQYMCTKFGVNSSNRFHFRALKNRQTDRQTDRQTRLNALSTPAAMPAWVIIKNNNKNDNNNIN